MMVRKTVLPNSVAMRLRSVPFVGRQLVSQVVREVRFDPVVVVLFGQNARGGHMDVLVVPSTNAHKG